MTKAIYCDYSPIDQAFLSLYKSSTYEASTFKGIPIKFRGRSRTDIWYKRPQSYCHKFAAETFAIYYDNDYELHLGRP
jgi:hypothetical protein